MPQTSSSFSFSESAVAELRELVGEIAHQALHVDLAQKRRRFAHHHRALTERLDHQAQFGQLVDTRGQPRDAAFVELDHFGQEQDLARDAGRGDRRFHALVNQPLMRRMLIDDDDAVIGLGDDIGLVQLRPRRAQRELRRFFSQRTRPAARPALARAAAPDKAAALRRSRATAQNPADAQTARNAAGRRYRHRHRTGARKEASAASATVVEARWPALAIAWRSAPTIRPRTSDASRKRTSAFAGWTLTSTFRRAVEEQRHHRVAIARQKILIRATHRAGEQLVAHRPAVDEEILVARRGAVERRQAGKAGQTKAFARGVDLASRCRRIPCRAPRRGASAGRRCRSDRARPRRAATGCDPHRR